MGMSITLREFLDEMGTPYDLLSHPHTIRSMETAAAAHVPGDQLAKSVVVEDDHGYMMVVVPSTHHVELGQLRMLLGRPFGLATETEIEKLFDDCELGSIPALGQAYGIDVMVDESLLECDEVYFEAGDHTQLVHLAGQDFEQLMALAGHGHFSRHTEANQRAARMPGAGR